MFKYIILLILFYSCERRGIYECVCYPKTNPSNYTKYVVKNTHSQAYNNCKLLSDTKQNCSLTE